MDSQIGCEMEYGSRESSEGSRANLGAAFRQISVARKIKFENNIAEFSGTALGQIIKAVQGGQVYPMVIDSCGDSALCSPLAGVLQDFTKDLLQLLAHREASKQEAIQDAVAKTAEETRKAAAQAESADKEKTEWMQKNLFLSQEKAEWMQKNQKLQSQLHATNLRELAALRSTTQLKRDLSAAKRHASDSARDVSVTQQHAEQHAAELKEFVGDSKQRAEGADALQQLSVTLKSQLTAETERALSSEARVFTLDLHLAESRAEVDKLTAQVAKLEEDQDFKVELADEKARHLATVQAAGIGAQEEENCWTTTPSAHKRGHVASGLKEKQGEQAFAEALAAVGHQGADLGHQVEEAAQRRPSPQQEGVAWVQEVSRLQARHGTPTAPLQQDTNALLDKHGVQLEIQELQQELQDTKAALHLSKDRLQKAHATIDCLRKEEEASWQQMNRRHEELLEQIKILKARLSRMGALDEDAMRNDIQDYKSCPEVFDRYGNPVRVAESVRAMWPCGLPPPTDPRLVKSVVKLNMPPEELAFHVPRYGLVTTANCKQLMLLLEDRHGEAGVDNQDLGLTLLRAAQSVWVAASLIPWAQYNADLTVLGMSGRPVMSPADQRRCFTVISRESLEDPAPHFSRYLAGMMAE
ncbi:hypothetical protein WJX79_001401 [Trebouxia sp. C0005]